MAPSPQFRVAWQPDETVVEVLIDRPPVNALSLAMWREFREVLLKVQAGPARCVVLGSALESVFCAGGDIKEFAELDADSRRARHAVVSETTECLAMLPIPVVCAVNGAAVGAGVAIAAACDIRVVSPAATFALPEIARGTVAGGGSFLRQLGMPEGQVRRLLLTGEAITADEASRYGLADVLAESHHGLRDTAIGLATAIAKHPASAVRIMKAAILETHQSHTDWLRSYNSTHDRSAQLTADGYGREEIRKFLGR
jgi:enoyl-CoA hydratase/carnithine racemase